MNNQSKQLRMKKVQQTILSFASLLICSITLIAQPSGGPYGPLNQTYEIPSDAGKVYYVAPIGDASQPGTDLAKPTTLEKAIEKVVTGDAIILRGGTYRTGNLKLNQGITLQPYKNEKPVLKGTFIANEWEKLRSNLWITSWEHFFPSAPADWWRVTRESMFTPLYKFNDDMVFVNGKFLNAVGWPGEVDENSYFIDYKNKQIYIGTDPVNKLVEITAFNVALHRILDEVHGKKNDGKGSTIKGITFTQYAYRALEFDGYNPEEVSPESAHGKDVVGTTVEHCEISFCSRVAGYFRGDNFTMRHCKISDTSTEGVYVLSSNDVLLERNIFARNNIENITGYYPAAVKIFNQCYRVTCNDNLIIDHPNSNGIWYDVGNVDGVFTNNWVQNVGLNNEEITGEYLWPSQNGFFFEISKGAICAGNVFVNCDHGVMSLNSSDVQFYNNTFVNSMACIGRDQRSAQGDHFGWHPASGPDVDERVGHVFANNLLVADENFPRPLMLVWQPSFMCDKLNNSQLKEMDHNVFVKASTVESDDIMLWSPAQNTKCQVAIKKLDDLKALYPAFSKNSIYLENYNYPVFKSTLLGNYELIPEFTEGRKNTVLPEALSKIIKRSNMAGVGAYSLMK